MIRALLTIAMLLVASRSYPAYYLVYDNTTGNILRSGECAPGDIQAQAKAGESVMQYKVTNENRVVNGVPVYVQIPPTQEELAAIESRERYDLVQRKMFKAMFYLANEIRALKGQSPVTVDQFKTWLRNL